MLHLEPSHILLHMLHLEPSYILLHLFHLETISYFPTRVTSQNPLMFYYKYYIYSYFITHIIYRNPLIFYYTCYISRLAHILLHMLHLETHSYLQNKGVNKFCRRNTLGIWKTVRTRRWNFHTLKFHVAVLVTWQHFYCLLQQLWWLPRTNVFR